MAIAAIIPISTMAAANASLEANEWGPRNFSIPLWDTAAVPEYAGAHFAGNVEAPLVAAIKALPNVTTSEINGTGADRFRDCYTKAGCLWGQDFPLLEGVVTPGNYQRPTEGGAEYWKVIQQYDTATWPDPSAPGLLALVRRLRIPGQATPWVQPIDQFDGYYLSNPFTGEPDRVTHNGSEWAVSQADAGAVNTFEPGAFGWTNLDPAPAVSAWVQPTGAADAYAIGDEVTHENAQDGGNVWLFRSKIPANTTEPGTDGTFHRWWEPVQRV